ncbi:MAG TPA: hypothetical protein PKH94_02860 [Bacteroidales bacterium]|nr:hypothetical protein [Bacteroidales bacterium]HNS46155.1 hypothetical protein [Bacteroidales bacterium]
MKILTTGQNSKQRCILEYIGISTGNPILKQFTRAGSFTTLEPGILDVPTASKTYTFQFASDIPCPEAYLHTGHTHF